MEESIYLNIAESKKQNKKKVIKEKKRKQAFMSYIQIKVN